MAAGLTTNHLCGRGISCGESEAGEGDRNRVMTNADESKHTESATLFIFVADKRADSCYERGLLVLSSK